MDTVTESWAFDEGAQITPELSAVKRLGGGSAYEAYLAFDELTWGPVVVKLLRPDQVGDPSGRRSLLREVTALDTVNHPVVVRKLRHDLEGERPHVVLESIDGPRLSTLVRRYGPLQPAQYLPLAIDISSALQYLRHLEYVHLDIKPSNVIMGAPARLIDLSVARTEEARPRSTTRSAPTPTWRRSSATRHGPVRRRTPPTCSAWPRRCSRRWPATALSTTATRRRATLSRSGHSSSRRRTTCRRRCRSRWPRS